MCDFFPAFNDWLKELEFEDSKQNWTREKGQSISKWKICWYKILLIFWVTSMLLQKHQF